MDVHWIDWILGVVAVSDGDETKRINTAFQLGILSSALEHAIPEQMFSTADNPADAISAVKALQSKYLDIHFDKD